MEREMLPGAMALKATDQGIVDRPARLLLSKTDSSRGDSPLHKRTCAQLCIVVKEIFGFHRVIGDYLMSTAKEHITEIINRQPDDSSFDEIVRELAFDLMVQRGLRDSDDRRTIANDEMERRIKT